MTALLADDAAATPVTAPLLDIVIPVFNEAADLEPCLRRLHDYLNTRLPFSFRITVADNGSTDATALVASTVAADLDHVAVLRLAEQGRGRALHAAWSRSEAAVLVYMDVDLSTDLAALLPLVAPLISGHSDIAIGTRLARGSRTVRGIKREIISRGYNLLLHGALGTGFSDAQCGFKAIRRDVAARLLPLVQDTGWFFDTELLVLAERGGLRIHEVPVDWIDDPDSRVAIVPTALADLRGVARIGRALLTGRLPVAELRSHLGRGELRTELVVEPAGLTRQLTRFAAIGAVSTAAYLLLFMLLRPGWGPQAANLAGLLLTTLGNTAANRRLTFGVTGRTGRLGHQVRGLVVFALGWALTASALGLLYAATTAPGRSLELGVLVLATVLAALLRFSLMRSWVFAGT